eukprot:Gb_14659 [translate_table: standard]
MDVVVVAAIDPIADADTQYKAGVDTTIIFIDDVTANSLRQKFQDEHRELVGRHIFTVTGKEAVIETIDKLIQTQDSERIFQTVMEEQGQAQLLDILNEIKERQVAVRDLEKKVFDLHQSITEMRVRGKMVSKEKYEVSERNVSI